MKIELDIPYIEDELNIKITIHKDGTGVLVNNSTGTTTFPIDNVVKEELSKKEIQPKEKKKTSNKSTPLNLGGNYMNADF
jgi:hypothetical protein